MTGSNELRGAPDGGSGGNTGSVQQDTVGSKRRWRVAAAAASAVLIGGMFVVIPAGAQLPAAEQWSGTKTCTADSAGYCTVQHPAATTPDAVVVTPSTPLMVGVDQLTTTTFRVRFARAVASNGSVTPVPGPKTFYVIVTWTPGSPTASPSATPTGSPTGTLSPTATPTPSPTLTPTPTPTPSPTLGGGCALPEYPTVSCTGVPAGTVFANTVNGEYHVTTPGMTIDRWHVTGALLVEADNVVITRSKIEGGVFNQFGSGASILAHPYTIADSTLGPDTGCSRIAGLQSGNYTATRVLIHNTDHGVDAGEPGHVLVQDSYMQMCAVSPPPPPDGSHVDGIQTYCPDASCTDITLRHNTMYDASHFGTFVINIKDPNVGMFSAYDNMLYGGDNYVIVTQWRTGANWPMHDNRVVNNTWGGADPNSGEGTCAHQDWVGNSIVTIDNTTSWHITSTVAPMGCIN